MLRRAANGAPPAVTTVAFLLLPGFALMSFAAAIEPLRAANHLSGRQLYRWSIVTPDGGEAQPSLGLGFKADHALAEGPRSDMVMVCAGGNPSAYRDARVRAWLRRQDRAGSMIGGVSGGPYLLARAGLLDGYRCTVHWEHLAAFVEEFPRLDTVRTLFQIDRNRLTCAGGAAALDMMHALIARVHGEALAGAVSEWFLQNEVRGGGDRQLMASRDRWGVSSARLAAALDRLDRDSPDMPDLGELAGSVGLSVRQLERLFSQQLGMSFSAYRLGLRLDRARRLLRQTTLSVLDVAMLTGFQSASHFSRTYKTRFKETPRTTRTERA